MDMLTPSIAIAILLAGVFIWWLPYFIARRRNIQQKTVIAILVALTVITGITWIVALIWSLVATPNKHS